MTFNRCTRCGSGMLLSEDIESDGVISVSCWDCGEVIPTSGKMRLSPGSPVMYAGGSLWPDDVLNALPPEDELHKNAFAVEHNNAVHSPPSDAEAWEVAFRAGRAIRDIALQAGKSRAVVYGVLRRRMGDEIRKYNTKSFRVG